MRNFLLRKVIICLFSLNLYASDLSIEDMDKLISEASNIVLKQALMCERETLIDMNVSNPNICLKAIEYEKNLNENEEDMYIKALVQMFSISNFEKKNPNYNTVQYVSFIEDYKVNYPLYFKEYKAERMSTAYYNAAIIYQFSKKYQNYKKAFELYKKAYDSGECNFSDSCGSALNLGYLYFVGAPGIEKNFVLGYKYTKESAEKGNQQAIINLKRACLDAPGICK